jgi:hypothetical protein
MRLLCVVVFLLAAWAGRVDASSGTCFVGVYGWTCTPSDLDSALVAYNTIISLSSKSSSSTATSSALSQTASGASTAAGSCLGSNCAAGCSQPCDTACSEAQFAKLKASATYAGKAHYFIDPYRGDDGSDGTEDRPWATVHRGEAHLRWARAAAGGTTPVKPLQLWLRSEPGIKVWRPLQLNG